MPNPHPIPIDATARTAASIVTPAPLVSIDEAGAALDRADRFILDHVPAVTPIG